jgi:hypothetical protein
VTIRIVSELCHIPPETLGQHRHLRGHADVDRCCGKLLIGTALVGFGMRQHAQRESISKRAPPGALSSNLRTPMSPRLPAGVGTAIRGPLLWGFLRTNQRPRRRRAPLVTRMQPATPPEPDHGRLNRETSCACRRKFNKPPPPFRDWRISSVFSFVSPAIWQQNRLTASLGLCAICDFFKDFGGAARI